MCVVCVVSGARGGGRAGATEGQQEEKKEAKGERCDLLVIKPYIVMTAYDKLYVILSMVIYRFVIFFFL